MYEVQRGEVVDNLTFTGRVSPLRESELYFHTDGRVLAVYVERGDMVEAGDRLAELDVDALHRQLTRAELDLESARTDLESAELNQEHELERARLDLEQERIARQKLRTHDSSADLAVVKAELEQASWTLQTAQANYDRVAHFPNVAMLPEATALHEATLAHARAEAAYRQAQRQAERQATEQRYDIQTQQKRVDRALLELERLEEGVDPRLRQAVAKAELEIEELQAQITDTVILAPLDGEVTSLSTAAGKAVEGFKPVIIVADPSELEVTAELSPDDMRELSEGQEAAVVPVEFPGEELPASIRLLPYPYGSGGSAVDVEEEDRNTHLSIDTGGLSLEPGDLVRATVALERKADALWLPPAAIRTFEGRKFVVLQDGAGQRQVDVILGIESADRIEIEEGLSEGDVVVGP
jgi:RND family efflux transporter MFP subunit